MKKIISSVAFSLSQLFAQQHVLISRSHILEVIAALFGYRTYAAFTLEENDPASEYCHEDAEYIVLNREVAWKRVIQLDYSLVEKADFIVDSCIDVLKKNITRSKVFVGVEDFYVSLASSMLAEAIYDADDTSNAMAGCNAIFPDEPQMEDEYLQSGNLWVARAEWTIEADGVMEGEYDIDGDRTYNGHILNGHGLLRFQKAGRAGLIYIDSEGSAGLSDEGSMDEWEEYLDIKTS